MAHQELPASATDRSRRLNEALGRDDAGEQARELTQLLHEAQRLAELLSQSRDAAVVQMRTQGASYDDIARVLGVSKSRVQQLVYQLTQTQPTRRA